MGRKSLLILFLSLVWSCSSSKPPGSTLRMNLYSEPPTLNPHLAIDITSANVLIALFEGLTRVDSNLEPQLALAKSVEISADKKTYTFTLRPSTWSDGTPLTSTHFAEAWKRVLDPSYPSPSAYKLFVIRNGRKVKMGELPKEALGIQTPDPHTLIVTLENPTPYFLELLAFTTFFPAPLEGQNEETPTLFNGPFKLAEWRHEESLLLEKNPAYWDAEAVLLEQIHFVMIDNGTTECYLFEKGELDWAGSPLSSLPSDLLPALRKEGEVHTAPARGALYYAFNTTLPVLNNSSIRKALAYAICRADLVQHILQGDQRVAEAIIPPLPPHWKAYSYFKDGDEARAKELFGEGLKELGLTKEEFPPLTLSFNIVQEHKKVAEAIREVWKRVFDIEVHLESFEWRVFLAKQRVLDFQICRSGWLGDFNDPLAFLDRYQERDIQASEGLNETGWSDSTFGELLRNAKEEIDLDKRRQLLEQAEALFMDQMPLMPLYFLNFNYLKKPHVRNLAPSPFGILDFKEAFIAYD